MKDLLLEIGCENIPASYIPPAFAQLEKEATRLLKDLRVPHGTIMTTGAPRRLVLIVSNLAEQQESEVQTFTGPPISKCYDDDGKPTKAAEGFARSQGVPLARMKTIKTDRGEYLGFTRKLKSRKTAAILKEHLPELISNLKFPKTMRWERSNLRFARPIRWIVCLFGEKVVRFELAGVKSGNVSYGVPWLDKRKIKITSAAAYAGLLKERGVIVDDKIRRESIERMARQSASDASLELIEDPALFEEQTFLLESPHVFIGEFPEKYLELPPEVVITAMKAHQRYFALKGPKGRIVPRFLSFCDWSVRRLSEVKRGNEKVLKARLEDALFYYREDVKKGIYGLSEKLDGIVFIEGLGSIKDKSARMGQLMESIDQAQETRRFTPEDLSRIASMAKADLASEMVKDGKEFTLLEGIIGGYYARAAGENDETVRALEEQYAPRTPSAPLPGGYLGTYLSIVDKVDTICGCFLADLIPTGSQDPYGLRRQAVGLIRILEDRPLITLDRLIETSLAIYERSGVTILDDTDIRLEDFFKTRLETLMKEKGIAYDIVGAVIPLSWMAPAVCFNRGRTLQAFRGDRSFELLITGVKRVGNILSTDDKAFGHDWRGIENAFSVNPNRAETGAFSPDLFEDEAEKALYDAILSKIPVMKALDEKMDFEGTVKVLSSFGAPIDHYFDKVLVNCDDKRMRNNRLRFLSAVFALFSRYADFSYIVEEGLSP